MKPRTRAGWGKSSLSGVMMIDELRHKTSRHKTQEKRKKKLSVCYMSVRLRFINPLHLLSASTPDLRTFPKIILDRSSLSEPTCPRKPLGYFFLRGYEKILLTINHEDVACDHNTLRDVGILTS
jgi:hypothetical protein